MNVPVELAEPEGDQFGQQQVQAVADLGLAGPDHAAGSLVRQPVEDDRADRVQANHQRDRRGPAQPGRTRRAQVRKAGGQPGQGLDGSDERGQYGNNDRTSWKA
jgi:hypothetical protein